MSYQGKYRQNLAVVIKCEHHDSCLFLAKTIKRLCEAWFCCVQYIEHKSARKGAVLGREISIIQEAKSDDIIIFKESLRRICNHLDLQEYYDIKIIDQGSVPLQ